MKTLLLTTLLALFQLTSYGASTVRFEFDTNGTVFVKSVPVVVPSASTTVNLWQDFEFDTVSDANLAANDHCADGTWVVTDAGGKLSTSTSGESATLTSINGSADSGTRGLAYDHTGGTAARATYTFASSKTSAAVSYGFWYKSPPISSNVGDWALMSSGSAAGSSTATLQIERESGTLHVRVFGSDVPAYTNITANTLYWMTIKIQRGATCSLSVYSAVGSLVATSSCTGNDVDQERFVLVTAQTRDISGTAYFDDLIVDWSTAAFPLGIP
jgi:hypothetical protein